jgi:hypothetical protein
MRSTRRRRRGAIDYPLMPLCAIIWLAGLTVRKRMMSYPDYDDYDTRDQLGYGLGPDDCPACGAPPGEQHGCSLAERSSVTGRHPEVTVQLTGTDGSASAVMGQVQRALRDAGVPQREVDQFRLEATSGDHDHLLQTCMHWVDVS